MIEAFTQNPALWTACFALFGLVCGSFLNVLISRLPRMMENEWEKECDRAMEKMSTQKSTLNLASPPSHCVVCNITLAWYDNIPLISFIMLRGKCRHCQAPIYWQYPLVELMSALMAAYLAHQYGFDAKTFLLFGFFAMTLSLAWIDIQTGLLPDILTISLLWLGLLASVFLVFITPQEAILGAAFGYFSLWSIYQLFLLLRKKETMGYGDFKLTAALGAWLGSEALIVAVLFAAFSGAVVGLFQIFTGKAELDTPFPFGPYLAVSGLVMLLLKDEILKFIY